MPKSPVDVFITQYRYEKSRVTQKVKVTKKVNGKRTTTYENKTVNKWVLKRETVILPVTPEEIRIARERSFDDQATVNQRIYTRSGALGGRTISLSSFFTNQGSYLQTRRTVFGYKTPEAHAKWFDARLNADTWLIEIRIPKLGVRGFFNLRQFEYSTIAGLRDLNYTMTWVERNVPKVRTTTIK